MIYRYGRCLGVAIALVFLMAVGGLADGKKEDPYHGLVISVHPDRQQMVVSGACGTLQTVRWGPSTRIMSHTGLPWESALQPGTRVELTFGKNHVVTMIDIRTQMDEAAWYISRIVNAFRIQPSYIARLHTQGFSFEDITKALIVARRRVKTSVKAVLEMVNDMTWEKIADRYDIAPQELDNAVAVTFGGEDPYGMGGMDR